MLVHLVVNSSGLSVPLCLSDKQFILWTIREVAVTSAELDSSLVDASLQWLVWLLNCPVTVRTTPTVFGMNQSKPTAGGGSGVGNRLNSNSLQLTPERGIMEGRSHHHSTVMGSSDSSFTSPPGRTAGLFSRGSASASGGSVNGDDGTDEQHKLWLVPLVRPHVPQVLRLMVVQELRLLIAGEVWSSVLTHSRYKEALGQQQGLRHGQESTVPVPVPLSMPTTGTADNGVDSADNEENIFENVIYRIGTCKPAGSSRTRLSSAPAAAVSSTTTSPCISNAPFAAARVPMSSSTMKMHLVRCGAVRSVYSILFGNSADARIRDLLNSAVSLLPHGRKPEDCADSSLGSLSLHGPAVCELALETWWSAFGFLYLLVLGSDEVKTEIDATVGMEELAKELLPLSMVPDMPTAVSQLLVEVCVGSGSASQSQQQAFHVVTKVPRSKLQIQTQTQTTSSSSSQQFSSSTPSPVHGGLNTGAGATTGLNETGRRSSINASPSLIANPLVPLQPFGLLRRLPHKVPSTAYTLPECYHQPVSDHDVSVSGVGIGAIESSGRGELALVSSCYYARERSLFAMMDCVRPLRLVLRPLSSSEKGGDSAGDEAPVLRRNNSNNSNQRNSSNCKPRVNEMVPGYHSNGDNSSDNDSDSVTFSDAYISSQLMQTLGRTAENGLQESQQSTVGGGSAGVCSKRGLVRESSYSSLPDADLSIGSLLENRGRTQSTSSTSSTSFHSAHALLLLRATLTGHTPTPSVAGVGERLGPSVGPSTLARIAYVPLFRPLQNTLLESAAPALAQMTSQALHTKYQEEVGDGGAEFASAAAGRRSSEDGVAGATTTTSAATEDSSPECLIANYLDLYTPHKNVSGQSSGTDTIRTTTWYPAFSRLTLRSVEAAEMLFTLAVLSIGSELHSSILSLLSHMIDGNPLNGRLLMTRTRVPLAVFGLIVGALPEKQRGTFSYLLSQMLRYLPNPTVTMMLLKFCRTTCTPNWLASALPLSSGAGVDCATLLHAHYQRKSMLMDAHVGSDGIGNNSAASLSGAERADVTSSLGADPVINSGTTGGTGNINGVSKLVTAGSVGAVCGSTPARMKDLVNQVLYILGRLVERGQHPYSYLHFNRSERVFENPLLLPRCVAVSNAVPTSSSVSTTNAATTPDPRLENGMSICTWVRVGTLGDYPVSSFLQLSGATYVIDVFFRVVYKSSLMDYEKGSVSSGISTLPGDMVHCEESSKRSLQLCISLTSTVTTAGCTTTTDNTTDDQHSDVATGSTAAEVDADVAVGIGGDEVSSTSYQYHNSKRPSKSQTIKNKSKNKLVTSFVQFSAPHFIIDYDWSEMGDWHLLYLHFSNVQEEGGGGCRVECRIDGELKTAMPYWKDAQFGYTPLDYSYAGQLSSHSGLQGRFSATSSNSGRFTGGCTHYHQAAVAAAVAVSPFVFPDRTEYALMNIALGGVHHEQEYIYSRLEVLNNWASGCRVGVGEYKGEISALRELRLLQAYAQLVCGFSGTVTEVVVCKGALLHSLLTAMTEKGPKCSLCAGASGASGASGIPLPQQIAADKVLTSISYAVVEAMRAHARADLDHIDTNNNSNRRSGTGAGAGAGTGVTPTPRNSIPRSGSVTSQRALSPGPGHEGVNASMVVEGISGSSGRLSPVKHGSSDLGSVNAHSDGIAAVGVPPPFPAAVGISPLASSSPGTVVAVSTASAATAISGAPPASSSSSSSLVSELLTMFSSSSSGAASGELEEDSATRRNSKSAWARLGLGVPPILPGFSAENAPVLSGVETYDTPTAVAGFEAVGGVRVLYPLLVVDRTRQIAGLRIIAALISSLSRGRRLSDGGGGGGNSGAFSTGNSSGSGGSGSGSSAVYQNMDNVILFCLHGTPNHLSLESVQVLFELITDPEAADSGSGDRDDAAALRGVSSGVDLIRNPMLLRLVINIAVASPKRPQVARGTVEWLRNICEDTDPLFFNSRILLREVGVLPFVLLLSMWGLSDRDCAQLLVGAYAGDKDAAIISTSTGTDASDTSDAGTGAAAGCCEPLKFSSSDASRLQSQTAKLIKQLICGTYGDPFNMDVQVPPLSQLSSASLTTATGFSVSHMATILNFVGKATRYD